MDTGLVDIIKYGHLADFNNLLDPNRISFTKGIPKRSASCWRPFSFQLGPMSLPKTAKWPFSVRTSDTVCCAILNPSPISSCIQPNTDKTPKDSLRQTFYHRVIKSYAPETRSTYSTIFLMNSIRRRYLRLLSYASLTTATTPSGYPQAKLAANLVTVTLIVLALTNASA